MTEQAVIEEVTDIAEAVVPEVVETIEVVRNNPYLLAGAAVVGLAIGGTVGYFVADKILKEKYEEISRCEIGAAKEYYSAIRKEGDYETVAKAAEKLLPQEIQDVVSSYRGETNEFSAAVEETQEGITIVTQENSTDDDDNEVTVVRETSNIFVDGVPLEDLDLEEEAPKRLSGAPFVITEEEFHENQHDHEQLNLTYYQGDKVVANETDNPVENTTVLIGDECLERFGHGSNDRNSVYVRNMEKGLDFEIVRSPGKFANEVLGLDYYDQDNLRHSSSIRRFRDQDE